MKQILILDTETTGLDPQKDRVIEVAVALYSLEHATVLETYSSLMQAKSNEAEHINRIPAAVLLAAHEADRAWAAVLEMAHEADAIVAHRSEFDHSFSPAALQVARPWVCSKYDLKWPRQEKPGGALVQLALAHDLGVAYAHRAAADVDLLARLFTRSHELGEDLAAMIAYGMRPKALFVSLAPFEEKDVVKAAGFEWEPAPKKRWVRRMAIEDAATLPFKTARVEERRA